MCALESSARAALLEMGRIVAAEIVKGLKKPSEDKLFSECMQRRGKAGEALRAGEKERQP